SECLSRLRHVRPLRAVPVIAPGDQWGNWAFLLSAAAFGTWAEERTAWGAALSGALVSILAGLAASSAGLVAPGAPAQAVVMEYLLPVAVPLLLLGADLRRVVRTTGDLLKAFLIGSVATVIGTTVAYLLFPMRSLGQDGWKIAAALMGSYIGGGGEFRGDLGGAGHDAVGGGGGRGGGQPHLRALLHGPLRAGVQDTAGGQERLVPGGRRRGRAPGRHVRAARRRGAGAVVRDLQGRHGDRGGAGRGRRRHSAVRDGAGGAPGDGVPGRAGETRAVRRDHGADPDAGVLRGGGRQRQRGGRGDQGARRVRVRRCAGGRAPRRGARGREAGRAGQEAAARR
uniref:Uncharacterized protein n=1 Tax=Aegilops tauschii subsp. strangulata TaxID=200361 RepID=A0A453QC16_AEGTS